MDIRFPKSAAMAAGGSNNSGPKQPLLLNRIQEAIKRNDEERSVDSLGGLTDLLTESARIVTARRDFPDLTMWLNVIDSLVVSSDGGSKKKKSMNNRRFSLDSYKMREIVPLAYEVTLALNLNSGSDRQDKLQGLYAASDIDSCVFTFKRFDEYGKPMYEYINQNTGYIYSISRRLALRKYRDPNDIVKNWLIKREQKTTTIDLASSEKASISDSAPRKDNFASDDNDNDDNDYGGLASFDDITWRWYLVKIPSLDAPAEILPTILFFSNDDSDDNLPPVSLPWVVNCENVCTFVQSSRPPILKIHRSQNDDFSSPSFSSLSSSAAGGGGRSISAVEGGSFIVGKALSAEEEHLDLKFRAFVVASLEFISKLLTVCEKRKYIYDKIEFIFNFMRRTFDFEISNLACDCLFNLCLPRHQCVLEAHIDSDHSIHFIPLKSATRVWDIFFGTGFCSLDYGFFDFISGQFPIGYVEKEESRTLTLQLQKSSLDNIKASSSSLKTIVLDIKTDVFSSLKSYHLNQQFDMDDLTVVSYSLLAIHTLLSGDYESRLNLIKFRIKCLFIMLHCNPQASNGGLKGSLLKLFSSESIILKELVALCDNSGEMCSNIKLSSPDARPEVNSLSILALQSVLFLLSLGQGGGAAAGHFQRFGSEVFSTVGREMGLHRDNGRNRSSEQFNQGGDSAYITILNSVLVSASSLLNGTEISSSSEFSASNYSACRYIQLGLELLLTSFSLLNDRSDNESNLSFRALVPQIVDVINSFLPFLRQIVENHTTSGGRIEDNSVTNIEKQFINIISKCCFCLETFFGSRHRHDDDGSSPNILSVMNSSKVSTSLLQLLELFSSKVDVLLSSECALSQSSISALEGIVSLYSKYLRRNYTQIQMLANPADSDIAQLKNNRFFHQILEYLFTELREGQEQLWCEFILMLKDMIHIDTPYIRDLIVSPFFTKLMKSAHYSILYPNMTMLTKNPNVQPEKIVLALCKLAYNCRVIKEGQAVIQSGLIEFIIETTVHPMMLARKAPNRFLEDVGKQLNKLVQINELKELILTTFVNKIDILCKVLNTNWVRSYVSGVSSTALPATGNSDKKGVQRLTEAEKVQFHKDNEANTNSSIRAKNLRVAESNGCPCCDEFPFRCKCSDFEDRCLYCGPKKIPYIEPNEVPSHQLDLESEYMIAVQKVSNICLVFDSFLSVEQGGGHQNIIRPESLPESLLSKLIGAYWCVFPNSNHLFTQIGIRQGKMQSSNHSNLPNCGFLPAFKHINALVKQICIMSFTSAAQTKKVSGIITHAITSRLSLLSFYHSKLVSLSSDTKSNEPSFPEEMEKIFGSLNQSHGRVSDKRDEASGADIVGVLDKLPAECFPNISSESDFFDKNDKVAAHFTIAVLNLEWLISVLVVLLRQVAKFTEEVSFNFDFAVIERLYDYFRSVQVEICKFSSGKWGSRPMQSYKNNSSISDCFSDFDSSEDIEFKFRDVLKYEVRVVGTRSSLTKLRENVGHLNSNLSLQREIAIVENGCIFTADARCFSESGEGGEIFVCYRTKNGWLCGLSENIEVLSVVSNRSKSISFIGRGDHANEMLTVQESVCVALSSVFKNITSISQGVLVTRTSYYEYIAELFSRDLLFKTPKQRRNRFSAGANPITVSQDASIICQVFGRIVLNSLKYVFKFIPRKAFKEIMSKYSSVASSTDGQNSFTCEENHKPPGRNPYITVSAVCLVAKQKGIEGLKSEHEEGWAIHNLSTILSHFNILYKLPSGEPQEDNFSTLSSSFSSASGGGGKNRRPADSCVLCRNSLDIPSIDYQLSPVPSNAAGKKIAVGSCGHVYHLDCIQRWLRNRSICPMCEEKWHFAQINELDDLNSSALNSATSSQGKHILPSSSSPSSAGKCDNSKPEKDTSCGAILSLMGPIGKVSNGDSYIKAVLKAFLLRSEGSIEEQEEQVLRVVQSWWPLVEAVADNLGLLGGGTVAGDPIVGVSKESTTNNSWLCLYFQVILKSLISPFLVYSPKRHLSDTNGRCSLNILFLNHLGSSWIHNVFDIVSFSMGVFMNHVDVNASNIDFPCRASILSIKESLSLIRHLLGCAIELNQNNETLELVTHMNRSIIQRQSTKFDLYQFYCKLMNASNSRCSEFRQKSMSIFPLNIQMDWLQILCNLVLSRNKEYFPISLESPTPRSSESKSSSIFSRSDLTPPYSSLPTNSRNDLLGLGYTEEQIRLAITQTRSLDVSIIMGYLFGNVPFPTAPVVPLSTAISTTTTTSNPSSAVVEEDVDLDDELLMAIQMSLQAGGERTSENASIAEALPNSENEDAAIGGLLSVDRGGNAVEVIDSNDNDAEDEELRRALEMSVEQSADSTITDSNFNSGVSTEVSVVSNNANESSSNTNSASVIRTAASISDVHHLPENKNSSSTPSSEDISSNVAATGSSVPSDNTQEARVSSGRVSDTSIANENKVRSEGKDDDAIYESYDGKYLPQPAVHLGEQLDEQVIAAILKWKWAGLWDPLETFEKLLLEVFEIFSLSQEDTAICEEFKRGSCHRGAHCRFSHDLSRQMKENKCKCPEFLSGILIICGRNLLQLFEKDTDILSQSENDFCAYLGTILFLIDPNKVQKRISLYSRKPLMLQDFDSIRLFEKILNLMRDYVSKNTESSAGLGESSNKELPSWLNYCFNYILMVVNSKESNLDKIIDLNKLRSNSERQSASDSKEEDYHAEEKSSEEPSYKASVGSSFSSFMSNLKKSTSFLNNHSSRFWSDTYIILRNLIWFCEKKPLEGTNPIGFNAGQLELLCNIMAVLVQQDDIAGLIIRDNLITSLIFLKGAGVEESNPSIRYRFLSKLLKSLIDAIDSDNLEKVSAMIATAYASIPVKDASTTYTSGSKLSSFVAALEPVLAQYPVVASKVVANEFLFTKSKKSSEVIVTRKQGVKYNLSNLKQTQEAIRTLFMQLLSLYLDYSKPFDGFFTRVDILDILSDFLVSKNSILTSLFEAFIPLKLEDVMKDSCRFISVPPESLYHIMIGSDNFSLQSEVFLTGFILLAVNEDPSVYGVQGKLRARSYVRLLTNFLSINNEIYENFIVETTKILKRLILSTDAVNYRNHPEMRKFSFRLLSFLVSALKMKVNMLQKTYTRIAKTDIKARKAFLKAEGLRLASHMSLGEDLMQLFLKFSKVDYSDDESSAANDFNTDQVNLMSIIIVCLEILSSEKLNELVNKNASNSAEHRSMKKVSGGSIFSTHERDSAKGGGLSSIPEEDYSNENSSSSNSALISSQSSAIAENYNQSRLTGANNLRMAPELTSHLLHLSDHHSPLPRVLSLADYENNIEINEEDRNISVSDEEDDEDQGDGFQDGNDGDENDDDDDDNEEEAEEAAHPNIYYENEDENDDEDEDEDEDEEEHEIDDIVEIVTRQLESSIRDFSGNSIVFNSANNQFVTPPDGMQRVHPSFIPNANSIADAYYGITARASSSQAAVVTSQAVPNYINDLWPGGLETATQLEPPLAVNPVVNPAAINRSISEIDRIRDRLHHLRRQGLDMSDELGFILGGGSGGGVGRGGLDDRSRFEGNEDREFLPNPFNPYNPPQRLNPGNNPLHQSNVNSSAIVSNNFIVDQFVQFINDNLITEAVESIRDNSEVSSSTGTVSVEREQFTNVETQIFSPLELGSSSSSSSSDTNNSSIIIGGTMNDTHTPQLGSPDNLNPSLYSQELHDQVQHDSQEIDANVAGGGDGSDGSNSSNMPQNQDVDSNVGGIASQSDANQDSEDDDLTSNNVPRNDNVSIGGSIGGGSASISIAASNQETINTVNDFSVSAAASGFLTSDAIQGRHGGGGGGGGDNDSVSMMSSIPTTTDSEGEDEERNNDIDIDNSDIADVLVPEANVSNLEILYIESNFENLITAISGSTSDLAASSESSTLGLGASNSSSENTASGGGGSSSNQSSVAAESTSGLICPAGYDLEIFNSLPPDLQLEVIQAHGESSNNTDANRELIQNAGYDYDTFMEFPEYIRQEYFDLWAREQRQVAARSNQAPAEQSESDMIMSLPPDLRQEALLGANEQFLLTLTPQLQEEARQLRERAIQQAPRQFQDRDHTRAMRQSPQRSSSSSNPLMLSRSSASAAGGGGGSGAQRVIESAKPSFTEGKMLLPNPAVDIYFLKRIYLSNHAVFCLFQYFTKFSSKIDLASVEMLSHNLMITSARRDQVLRILISMLISDDGEFSVSVARKIDSECSKNCLSSSNLAGMLSFHDAVVGLDTFCSTDLTNLTMKLSIKKIKDHVIHILKYVITYNKAVVYDLLKPRSMICGDATSEVVDILPSKAAANAILECSSHSLIESLVKFFVEFSGAYSELSKISWILSACTGPLDNVLLESQGTTALSASVETSSLTTTAVAVSAPVPAPVPSGDEKPVSSNSNSNKEEISAEVKHIERVVYMRIPEVIFSQENLENLCEYLTNDDIATAVFDDVLQVICRLARFTINRSIVMEKMSLTISDLATRGTCTISEFLSSTTSSSASSSSSSANEKPNNALVNLYSSDFGSKYHSKLLRILDALKILCDLSAKSKSIGSSSDPQLPALAESTSSNIIWDNCIKKVSDTSFGQLWFELDKLMSFISLQNRKDSGPAVGSAAGSPGDYDATSPGSPGSGPLGSESKKDKQVLNVSQTIVLKKLLPLIKCFFLIHSRNIDDFVTVEPAASTASTASTAGKLSDSAKKDSKDPAPPLSSALPSSSATGGGSVPVELSSSDISALTAAEIARGTPGLKFRKNQAFHKNNISIPLSSLLNSNANSTESSSNLSTEIMIERAASLTKKRSFNRALTSSLSFSSIPMKTSSPLLAIAVFGLRHKNLINTLIQSDFKLLNSCFSPLIQIIQFRSCISFENKMKYFYDSLRSTDNREQHRGLRINVRREERFFLEDSFNQLHSKSKDEWKGQLRVVFTTNGLAEEGVDVGGLTKEWFTLVIRNLLNPNNALFHRTDKHIHQPSSLSAASGNSNITNLEYYKFAGRVIGKAVRDHIYAEAHFTRSFLKHILSLPVDFTDLESVDKGLYDSLKVCLENNIEDIVDYQFQWGTEEFGVKKSLDLIPNGKQISVIDSNKMDFIKLVTHFKMCSGVKTQIEWFLEGFYDLVPVGLVSIFTPAELDLLICGLDDIDFDDLRQHTQYQNYSESDEVITWFWEAIRSFSKSDQASFLHFVTGTTRVPPGGFKDLDRPFSITDAHASSDTLPISHVCFNQLDLPRYNSLDELRDKLLLTVREGSEGFGVM